MSMSGTNAIMLGGFVGAIAAVALGIGIAGLTGGMSMTGVGTTAIISSFNNPIFGLVQFILGILGLTQTVGINVVSGFMVACQVIALVGPVALIIKGLTDLCTKKQYHEKADYQFSN